MEKQIFEREIAILEIKIKEGIKRLEENPEGTNFTWIWELIDACHKLKQWRRF